MVICITTIVMNFQDDDVRDEMFNTGSDTSGDTLLSSVKMRTIIKEVFWKRTTCPVHVTEKTTPKVFSFGVVFTVVAPLKSVC